MSENRNIPQVDTDRVRNSAQRTRYTAYMQCVRKLELDAKAQRKSREKAARMGGATV